MLATQRHEPVWPKDYREGDHVPCTCGASYQLWGSCDFQDRWRRHDDRLVTRQFVREMNEWLASWWEVPGGFDGEMQAAAFANPRRVAEMMRWATDHIEHLEANR